MIPHPPKSPFFPPPPPSHYNADPPQAVLALSRISKVSRENMADQGKLDTYEALVRLWAPRLDLVSPGDLGRFRTRHIEDRKSTRLNSSHANISYAVFCLKKK